MSTALLPAPVSFDADAITAKAKHLAELLASALMDHDDAIYDRRDPEEIESEPRSGFWPWTSGGYQVTLPASLAYHWSTGAAPAPIQPLIDTGNEIIADEWARRFPDRPPLLDCIRAEGEHTGIPAAWTAEAEEWESEAWASDDDAYFWKARVMFLGPEDFSFKPEEAGGEDEPYVFIDAYLNTDLNYGRDNIRWLSAYGGNPNQTVGDFKRSIPLRVFETMTEAELETLVEEALSTLP